MVEGWKVETFLICRAYVRNTGHVCSMNEEKNKKKTSNLRSVRRWDPTKQYVNFCRVKTLKTFHEKY